MDLTKSIITCLSKFVAYKTDIGELYFNFTYRDLVALGISCIYILGHRILVRGES